MPQITENPLISTSERGGIAIAYLMTGAEPCAIFACLGDPNGVIQSGRGSIAIDILTGVCYIKQLGYASNNGWVANAGAGAGITGNTGNDGNIIVANGGPNSQVIRASNWSIDSVSQNLDDPNVDTRISRPAGAFTGFQWNALLRQIMNADGFAFEASQLIGWTNTANNPGAAQVAGIAQVSGLLTLCGSAVGVAGRLRFPRNTIGTLAANQNDWAPTAAYYNLVDASGAVNITGLANGVDGEQRNFWYDGANGNTAVITFVNASASSAVQNRFYNTNVGNIGMGPQMGVEMVYDARMNSLNGGWHVSLL